MAKRPKKKSGGRDFVKGQSGNPEGRPPLPEAVKAARALNQTEFTLLANRFLYCTEQTLLDIENDPAGPALERTLAGIVRAALTQRDHGRLEWFLTRLIPKASKTDNLPPKLTIKTSVQGDGSLIQEIFGFNPCEEAAPGGEA